MITSAKEFSELCASMKSEDQHRAAHDSAPEAVWFEVLSNYPENTIWIIHNKTVPLSVLHHLAKHPDPKIRWAVALKRKLDESLFIDLSEDIDEDVRRQIAYNTKTPTFIIEKLAQDMSERVAEVARERLQKSGRSSTF